jgi:hypothetical protein
MRVRLRIRGGWPESNQWLPWRQPDDDSWLFDRTLTLRQLAFLSVIRAYVAEHPTKGSPILRCREIGRQQSQPPGRACPVPSRNPPTAAPANARGLAGDVDDVVATQSDERTNAITSAAKGRNRRALKGRGSPRHEKSSPTVRKWHRRQGFIHLRQHGSRDKGCIIAVDAREAELGRVV